MLDALCQGIESWWSVNATDDSKEISAKAVSVILGNMNGYLSGGAESAINMMTASNLAGQAINITQTTAAHAMSYKLTSLYKIPHGRAAFVCLPYVWEYMIENSKEDAKLSQTFSDIAAALRCKTPSDAVKLLKGINRELFEKESINIDFGDISMLANSVNTTRLKNNPVKLDKKTLVTLYTRILEELKFSEKNKSIEQKFMDFIDKCFSNYTPPPESMIFGDIDIK